jgi:uncharacterized protein
MSTFVDTSALYALLDEADEFHPRARDWMAAQGVDPTELLATHSYILVETIALVKPRLGSTALETLIDGYIPALSVMYVDEQLHLAALTALRASASRKASFVDRVSFEFMRQQGFEHAFAFDQDFQREGFELVP